MFAHDVFVGSKNHFGDYINKEITFSQLSSLPLIMLEENSSGRLFLSDFFKANGITLKPDIELGSHDLLISFAKAGLGVAAVTKEFSDMDDLFVLSTPNIPKRSICVCYSSHTHPPLAALKFMELIESKNSTSKENSEF